MSAQTEPVDVLAVMDSCTDELEKQPGCYYTDAAKLQEARAAIAELIEADKAYDYARRPNRPQNQHDLRETAERRAAALANVGGGK